MVVVTKCAICHALRKAIHEEIYQSPLSTHAFVENFLVDVGLAEKRTKRHIPVARWTPPLTASLKTDADVALSKTKHSDSPAAIIRDGNGAFLGASTVFHEGITHLAILEALACREGPALAADLGARRFVLSSNCYEVVRAMNEGSMEVFGHVVREIKQMTRSLESVIFQYEERRLNVDVLYLAKSAMCGMYGTASRWPTSSFHVISIS